MAPTTEKNYIEQIPGLCSMGCARALFENASAKFPISLKAVERIIKNIGRAEALCGEVTILQSNFVRIGNATYKYYIGSETGGSKKPWYATSETAHPIILIYIEKVKKGASKPVFYAITAPIETAQNEWIDSETKGKYRLNFEKEMEEESEAQAEADTAQKQKAKSNADEETKGAVQPQKAKATQKNKADAKNDTVPPDKKHTYKAGTLRMKKLEKGVAISNSTEEET